MVTRLLIVRHGASHHRADGVVGGPRSCPGLTAEGRAQVEMLGKRLVRELDERPAAVYSSVIPRAVETAQILASTLGQPEVIQDCDLCSWHIPAEADGMPTERFQRDLRSPGGGIYRPFEQGNESWAELVARTGRALERIAARHVRRTAVVVAHGETVETSLIVFGGLPLAPGFDVDIAPASITEWRTDGDPQAWPRPRWTLVRFNDSGRRAWRE